MMMVVLVVLGCRKAQRRSKMTKKVKRLIRKPYQLPMANYCRHTRKRKRLCQRQLILLFAYETN
jgi:hypothetical protein